MDVSGCKTYQLILPIDLDSQRGHRQVLLQREAAAEEFCLALQTDFLMLFFLFCFFTPYDPCPVVCQCLAHPETSSYVIGIGCAFDVGYDLYYIQRIKQPKIPSYISYL